MRLAVTENIIFWKLISCWPKFSLWPRKWISAFIFTSIHFRGLAKRRDRERKNRKHNTRAREKEQKKTIEEHNSQRARSSARAPIDPATQSSDPANEREKEREPTIHKPRSIQPPRAPIQPTKHRKNESQRSTNRHRSTSHRSRRALPDDHRAKRRRPTVSDSSNSHRSATHSPHLRPTRPIHTLTHLRSTHLTGLAHPLDPISEIYIYIYMYIFI